VSDHRYEKHATSDAAAPEYAVVQVRADGWSRVVAADHHDYVAFLAGGEEPPLVAYAPPALDESPLVEA